MGSNTTTCTTAPKRRGATRRGAAFAVLLAFGFAACGNDDDSTAASEPAAQEAAAAEPPAEVSGDESLELTDAPVEARATGEATATAPPINIDFGRSLVIEAGIVIVTSDIRTAVDEIMQITRDNGGAVFNTDVVIEDPVADGSIPGGGQITVRLPPEQLAPLIGDLSGVGTVRNQTQSVQDVTDRVTDLEVQIQQARLSVERMEALLADATDFDGLVAAERELVSRQTTYERLLAARRNLGDRVTLSTLMIQLQYAAPDQIDTVVEPDDKGLADAFSDGWNAFVGLLFGIAFVLAVLAPFLAVAIVVGLAGWFVGRRLIRRRDLVRNRHEPLGPPTHGARPVGSHDSEVTAEPVPAQAGDDRDA